MTTAQLIVITNAVVQPNASRSVAVGWYSHRCNPPVKADERRVLAHNRAAMENVCSIGGGSVVLQANAARACCAKARKHNADASSARQSEPMQGT
jgi:hypothetical protein